MYIWVQWIGLIMIAKFCSFTEIFDLSCHTVELQGIYEYKWEKISFAVIFQCAFSKSPSIPSPRIPKFIPSFITGSRRASQIPKLELGSEMPPPLHSNELPMNFKRLESPRKKVFPLLFCLLYIYYAWHRKYTVSYINFVPGWHSVPMHWLSSMLTNAL